MAKMKKRQTIQWPNEKKKTDNTMAKMEKKTDNTMAKMKKRETIQWPK